MGQVVLLVSTDVADVPISSSAIEALARLGVTTVSLAADNHATAIILEGWAFDPACSCAAIEALGGSPDEMRTLHPIAQLAVSAVPIQGGTFP